MHRSLRERTIAAAGSLALVAALVVGAASAGAQPAPLIAETFDADAGGMIAGPGGWEVSGGRYGTHAPVRSGAGAIGNSNLAVHETVVSGDIGIDVRLRPEQTRGLWDDASVVLGYQDPDNYLYVSVNESNDAMTSGIFAVVDGRGTELADMVRPFSSAESTTFRVNRIGDEITLWADRPDLQGTGPVASATTDLFPVGRVGVGSRNNAVFVHDLEVTATPVSAHPPWDPSLNWRWDAGAPVLPVSGGWELGEFSHALVDPVTAGAGTIGNSNIALNLFSGEGPDRAGADSQLYGLLWADASSSAWDDVSLVFGYQDPENYLFVSLNESNDPWTSGVFAVVDGRGFELADITRTVRGGSSHEVRVDRWDDAIWVYLDGALVATAETDLFLGGMTGFGSRNNAIGVDAFWAESFEPGQR
ncbi:MAG: hypothetical protein S0880_31365 [Actinomycetota bacterium]|nr:hypothetical protein [Actinomycetota bacterium]